MAGSQIKVTPLIFAGPRQRSHAAQNIFSTLPKTTASARGAAVSNRHYLVNSLSTPFMVLLNAGSPLPLGAAQPSTYMPISTTFSLASSGPAAGAIGSGLNFFMIWRQSLANKAYAAEIVVNDTSAFSESLTIFITSSKRDTVRLLFMTSGLIHLDVNLPNCLKKLQLISGE